MTKILSTILGVFFTLIIHAQNVATFSIPEASGFGLDTKGGQGGKIIVVSNLNSHGKGSLAEAIAYNGPRIIVFEVAGYIDLQEKSIEITKPFVTVAGQTAPSPGVTLINGGLSIKTHDVIIQHIKVRPGDKGRNKKMVGKLMV